MVWQRDRNSAFVLADSGGYSAIRNNLNVDWSIPQSVDDLRWELLQWIERVPDAAIHLDIPLYAIGQNPHFRSFDDCLNMTIANIKHWSKNCRNQELKWVMPIHGRNAEEAKVWWKAILETEAPFEGIALGGNLGFSLHELVKTLVRVKLDGYLEKCTLIHVLGHFGVDYFLALTLLQKVLNKHVSPDIRITFDAATPFKDAESGILYSSTAGSGKRPIVFRKYDAFDSTSLNDMDPPQTYPVGSLTLMDIETRHICVKRGSERSFDTLSYILLSLHNIEEALGAFEDAYNLVFLDSFTPGGKHHQIVFQLLRALEDIFSSKNPYLEIHAHEKLLSTYL